MCRLASGPKYQPPRKEKKRKENKSFGIKKKQNAPVTRLTARVPDILQALSPGLYSYDGLNNDFSRQENQSNKPRDSRDCAIAWREDSAAECSLQICFFKFRILFQRNKSKKKHLLQSGGLSDIKEDSITTKPTSQKQSIAHSISQVNGQNYFSKTNSVYICL